MEYSYAFSPELEQEWESTERYATQPEILSYINHVADRFDLRKDMQFSTRVVSAHFVEASPDVADEKAERVPHWRVTTDAGETLTASFCVMATGCLSSANTPDFAGLDSVAGEVYHTSQWPHEGVEISGKRVGVIGTGSSGVQSIPLIAAEADRLTVFQRTPNYSIPAQNRPLDPETQAEVKANYASIRKQNRARTAAFGINWGRNQGETFKWSVEERHAIFERYWEMGGLGFISAFSDMLLDEEANKEAADFVRGKLGEIVRDPKRAELLSPDHVLGCKRPCADTQYFEAFNRDNVDLIDVNAEPIERFTPTGMICGGREVELDCVVLATGFDAMTGALHAIDIQGRAGQSLIEKWSAGPVTFLGLGSSGFPNFFTITGPGSPSVLANMVTAIEQHVEWIADCLEFMSKKGHRLIEAAPDAEQAWVEHVNAVADETLYPQCNSWYLGANVPGKPRVFMPHVGFPPYVAKCEEVVAKGYEGFNFSST